jgi:hypothetical protein
MKFFDTRPFLTVVFSLGSMGFLCAWWITYLSFASHRAFPWTLWWFGLYWFWGAWIAGKRLLTRKQASSLRARRQPEQHRPRD